MAGSGNSNRTIVLSASFVRQPDQPEGHFRSHVDSSGLWARIGRSLAPGGFWLKLTRKKRRYSASDCIAVPKPAEAAACSRLILPLCTGQQPGYGQLPAREPGDKSERRSPKLNGSPMLICFGL